MRSSLARLAQKLLPAAAAIATLMLLVTGQLQGASVLVVSFTIDDTSPNAKVRSDLGIAYPDYRLPLVDGDFGCVEAMPTTDGHLHATLNRKIDAAGNRCNSAGSDRQYRIRLTDAPMACQKLVAAYGSGVVSISNGECELVWTANPRVRVNDLFKKGSPSSTPLAFLADKSGLNGLSYEIKALTNVPMSAPTSNQRVLTYDGQGMLYEFGNGKAKFVAEAFDLDLRMVFDRVAVTQ
jgi:hypothetical protein